MASAARIVSLNLLYDPRITADHFYHFSTRWPRIVEWLAREGAPFTAICLQEVHVDFLPTVDAYAEQEGLVAPRVLYHTPRQCYLVTLVPREIYVQHCVHAHADLYPKALTVHVSVGGITIPVTNVHLPLDAKVEGPRLKATEVFARAAAQSKRAVMVGDWNTLPGRGDAEQLTAARMLLRVVGWEFDDGVESTYWGYPHETEDLQAYAAPAVLDRLAVGASVDVTSAVCRKVFVELGGARVAISDHFPCVAEATFS